ncbi:hypothetical protein CK556_00470 [Mesoplasma chauliocola]|uniref:Uncharacterized protein n=1 Tax=Mesoplasma chauliocola TaxID=216427 RepID=A0A249SMJ2_9MOLU|nr:hypothetical protein [Mesoplasma chauliocola]ASZ08840.1 hypothetical protein CK556_00470 [Mesoplasma chauliocola]
MKKNITTETKILIIIEIISALCGLIGVILGILSLLSLNPNVWGGKADEHASFIFTTLTVGFDTLSTLTAILAFKFGGRILKIKSERGIKISVAERFANRLDLYSFFFGLCGLILSILSLLFLFDFMNTNPGSEIATIFSIIFDSMSAMIVVWVVKIMLKINVEEHKNKK